MPVPKFCCPNRAELVKIVSSALSGIRQYPVPGIVRQTRLAIDNFRTPLRMLPCGDVCSEGSVWIWPGERAQPVRRRPLDHTPSSFPRPLLIPILPAHALLDSSRAHDLLPPVWP